MALSPIPVAVVADTDATYREDCLHADDDSAMEAAAVDSVRAAIGSLTD